MLPSIGALPSAYALPPTLPRPLPHEGGGSEIVPLRERGWGEGARAYGCDIALTWGE